jgi:hypothetical protein
MSRISSCVHSTAKERISNAPFGCIAARTSSRSRMRQHAALASMWSNCHGGFAHQVVEPVGPSGVVVHQLLIWSDVGREPKPSVRLSRPAPVRSRPRPIPEGAPPSRTARAGRASRQTTRSDHADGTAPGTHRRRRRRRSAPPCHGCEKRRSDSLLDLRFLDRALSDIITPARSIVAGVA